MPNKPSSIHFMRVCIANFLFFVSLYMLFPVSPLEMAERLDLPVSQTGLMFLMLTLGMFLIGPFHAYLIDAYKRKRVCLFSFLGMLLTIFAYYFVDTYPQLLALCTLQGVFVGMGTVASITLSIDTIQSGMRSYGNITFSWILRMGMYIGAALGVWLYQWYSYDKLILVSIITGFVGLFFIARLYVPFRAPLVTCFCSTDRFILVRGWLPAINLMGIAFVPGLLLPVFHHHSCNIELLSIDFPFYTFVALGFPLALFLYRLCFNNDKSYMAITTGLILMLLSLLLFDMIPDYIPPFLLGLGLGLVSPEFLMVFIKLSQHCQRGTVLTTHFLAWQTGITAGIAVTCHLLDHATLSLALTWGRITIVASLLFFLLITYQYFKRMRIR